MAVGEIADQDDAGQPLVLQEQLLVDAERRILISHGFHVGTAILNESRREDVHPHDLHKILARFNIHGQFYKQEWHIKIRDDEDKPLWLIHPYRRVDVALLPLKVDTEKQVVTFYPLNEIANAAKNYHWHGSLCHRLSVQDRAAGVPYLEARQYCLRA